MFFTMPFRTRPAVRPAAAAAGIPAGAASPRAARAASPAPDATKLVFLLHCSAGSSSQWKPLMQAMLGRFNTVAPEIGQAGAAGAAGAEQDELPRIGDDVAFVRKLADQEGGPFHLVGHSYGGAVALRVALDMPERVASLTLIEPVSFHLLRPFPALWLEIRSLAQAIADAVRLGTPGEGMKRFVDYWNGAGAWDAMTPEQHERLTPQAERLVRDFAAVFAETTDLREYARLTMPTLLLCGENTVAPCRRIIDQLSFVLPRVRRDVIAGAGHMAPVTHTDATNRAVLDHLRGCTERPPAPRPVDGAAALRRYA